MKGGKGALVCSSCVILHFSYLTISVNLIIDRRQSSSLIKDYSLGRDSFKNTINQAFSENSSITA